MLCPSVQADQTVPDRVDFNRDVRPIFNEHCVACHGGVKQAGGLSFVYPESVEGVIEPGSASDSYLLDRVLLPVDEEEHMPPIEHGRALNEAEIATLRGWIDQGGEWGKHWAYQPPAKSNLNQAEDDQWSRSRIDRFILRKLRAAELSPQPEATAARWLRRVTLELTGLPPTPDEVDAFELAAEQLGDVAYEHAVDRLLMSSRYGERWASVWLDTIRYADSKGLGLDGRRTIWQFRDWVIRALGADMPYDEFTISQLAGDLLPDPTMADLLATACHRTTQTNEEGGTDDETFRTEAVIDRVSTTWQAWMGLSFGCVQCHSHPYDPIEHEEFYEFLAFFNNTTDSDLGNELPTLAVPVDTDDYPLARELDQQIEQIWKGEWDRVNQLVVDGSHWKPVSDLKLQTNNNTQVVVSHDAGIEQYQTTGTVQRNTTVKIDCKVDPSVSKITALRLIGFPKDAAKALVDSEWGFLVSHIDASVLASDGETTKLEFAEVISDEPDPLLDPNDSLNAKSSRGVGPYSRIHYPRTAAFLLKTPVALNDGDRLHVDLVFNGVELGAFPLIAHRGQIAVSDSNGFTNWLDDEDRVANRQTIQELRNKRKAIASIPTPIMSQRYEPFSRPSRVFDRGNQMTKTDPVEPGTPGFLPALSDQPVSPQDARLAMARWVASPRNPLTARVAVNRIWSQLFGVGIVETQEDFGIAGAAPSHPELLDDLAARFQDEMGWSIKTLLREIVLSSTYRQSARITPEALQIDPFNRLLSRGPRNRLPAEMIRDQALSIGGLLSDKQFGPPVFPPLPGGVWKPFQGSDKWSTVAPTDPNRYRRTIYTYTKRTIPYPVMASFDAPSREFCSMRRLPSNTPLQALMTLNDATFVEAAQGLAGRMADHDGPIDQQLDYGFRLATCRSPSETERAALRELYNESGDDSQAAMTAVANVLMNLDEVLSQ
ncbi:PSD1 and planctomycete cytochrome C domain-containing protein [Stieleria tagensis]|uniref:PSD1 and planctomycete cytochrome C domain-containing protein n=1 Tax=Stieleria tagensis TaxID=2956795 RepID=UPI00209B78FA|nr:PSD1 and planctomycete cytochrome C domain-containing protein [Stieleria tagensis]